MGQEYFINSQGLQDKIASLLPSQGGAGAGFDLSASTQIIPIIDLTESAEGSNLRQDLQTASSLNTTGVTAENGTTTVSNTTGYFLCQISYVLNSSSSANEVSLDITDGFSTSTLFKVKATSSSAQGPQFGNKEIVVRISAGETLSITSANTSCRINCSSHQIADINGNLTNL